MIFISFYNFNIYSNIFNILFKIFCQLFQTRLRWANSPCMNNILEGSESKDCHLDPRKKVNQEMTPMVRETMVQLWLAGAKVNQVAKHFNVCRNTVGLWIKRHKQGDTTDTKHRTGRPRATTREQVSKQSLSMILHHGQR